MRKRLFMVSNHKTKRNVNNTTKQDSEKKCGKPIISLSIEKRGKDIRQKFYYCMGGKKMMIIEAIGTLISLIGITFFIMFDKSLLFWILLLLSLYVLLLSLKRLILPFILTFAASYTICRYKEPIELEFYENNLGLFLCSVEMESFNYNDLEKISILPEAVWLLFKERDAVILPRHSIAPEERKIILAFLEEKRPDVELHYADTKMDRIQ